MTPRSLHGALAWERFNPWAASFERSSTHPRLAKRLERLGRQAAGLGKQPLVPFHKDRSPASFGDFVNDVLMTALPGLLLVLGLGAALIRNSGWLGLPLAGWGLGLALRALWSYPKGPFPPMAVASLLKKVDASPTRGSPCRLRGKIVGQGVPGLLWSQDLIFEDSTGFIFLDKRKPRQMLPFFFGLTHGTALLEQEVELEGWYRRDPEPGVEVRKLQAEGRTTTSFIFPARVISGFAICALGLWWGLA